ncbi:hypothetical protein [Blastomonas sp. SL216]|uniref:hypothetical protein n=1 Tax=Blastomonas sp. SL216 TaxID=2995169 RepID=UPI0023770261|nr:hypothetical protein OU999_05970 [Blastomonas sp. SL216]
MAKSITVRFYSVGKLAAQGPSLRTTLQAIYDLGEPAARQRQLAGGFVCRLERLVLEPGYVSGEMMRVRDTDLPCEVHPDGTRALGIDVPIGDGVAFCFREADHTLAIHYDPRVLSPGRFNDYLVQMHHAGQFVMEPVMDGDALARFQEQPLRKLKVRLARPQNLDALDDEAAPAGAAIQAMGEAYEAPEITVELSMGRNKGSLGLAAKAMVEQFLVLFGQGADVRSLHVTPDAGEGLKNEDINLLDSLLSEKGEVNPASDAPDDVYSATSAFVRLKLDDHG